MKEWPVDILDQYRAMNLIRPFTNRSEQMREGYIIELLRNQNVTKKKDYKTMVEILPYLGDKLPDFLEHEFVKKALDQISLAKTLGHKFMLKDTIDRMIEQIQLEYDKGEGKDEYVIKRFVNLINEHRSEEAIEVLEKKAKTNDEVIEAPKPPKKKSTHSPRPKNKKV